jgi:hypothetical protein
MKLLLIATFAITLLNANISKGTQYNNGVTSVVCDLNYCDTNQDF